MNSRANFVVAGDFRGDRIKKGLLSGSAYIDDFFFRRPISRRTVERCLYVKKENTGETSSLFLPGGIIHYLKVYFKNGKKCVIAVDERILDVITRGLPKIEQDPDWPAEG